MPHNCASCDIEMEINRKPGKTTTFDNLIFNWVCTCVVHRPKWKKKNQREITHPIPSCSHRNFPICRFRIFFLPKLQPLFTFSCFWFMNKTNCECGSRKLAFFFKFSSNSSTLAVPFCRMSCATQSACYVLFSHTANCEWNTHLYMHSFNRSTRTIPLRFVFHSHQTKLIVSRKSYMGTACATHTHTYTHE